MKKKLIAVAMGAMLAAGAAAAVTLDAAFDLVVTARDRWRDPFPELQYFGPPEPVPAQPPRAHLVAVKAWAARLAQRLRPTVTSRWRMCASA